MLTDEKLKEIRERLQRVYSPQGTASEQVAIITDDIPALLDELEALRAHLSAAGITRPEELPMVLNAAHNVVNYHTTSDAMHRMPRLRRALRACTGREE